jgi:hypothetical protein
VRSPPPGGGFGIEPNKTEVSTLAATLISLLKGRTFEEGFINRFFTPVVSATK